MHSQRLARPRRIPSAQPFQAPRSESIPTLAYLCESKLFYSIPHATSPVAVHSLSVSPTNNNNSSPIKESPLAEPTVVAAYSGTTTEPTAPAVPAEADKSAEMAEDIAEEPIAEVKESELNSR